MDGEGILVVTDAQIAVFCTSRKLGRTMDDVCDLVARMFSKEAAYGITEWAVMTGRELGIPTPSWCRDDYTGAVRIPLYITEPGNGSRLVIVEWRPNARGSTAVSEARAHRLALREAPPRFRRHLVEQAFPPIRLADGGIVLFLTPAGDGSSWHPITDLPPLELSRVVKAVARSVIDGWNRDFNIRTQVDVVPFLSEEIGPVGRVARQLAGAGGPAKLGWLRAADDPPLPNPLRLCGAGSAFASDQVDVITGRSHGDLLALRVLVRQGRGRPDPNTFTFVDLSSYSSSSQLGRDIVRLLLSATAHLITDWSPMHQRLLLSLLVAPDGPDAKQVPPVVTEMIRTVFRTAARSTVRCGATIWRRQYLLSLVAQALNLTTFESLDASLRWWFFRLAGYAARQLMVEFGRSAEIPLDAPVLANPFSNRSTEWPQAHHGL